MGGKIIFSWCCAGLVDQFLGVGAQTATVRMSRSGTGAGLRVAGIGFRDYGIGLEVLGSVGSVLRSPGSVWGFPGWVSGSFGVSGISGSVPGL